MRHKDRGNKERGRNWQIWRTGWKVKGHRGTRGLKGHKSLCYRAKVCVIKNIWWHFMEAAK